MIDNIPHTNQHTDMIRNALHTALVLTVLALFSYAGQTPRPPPEPAPITDIFYVEYYEPAVSMSVIVPTETGSWSPCLGLSANMTFWTYENIGWAAKLGIEEWRIRDGAFPFDINAVHAEVEGGAHVFPLGLFFRYAVPYDEGWYVDFSAGIEYLVIQPNATVVFHYLDHWNRPQLDQSAISFQSRFALAAGMDAGYKWDEYLSFLVGAHFRVDLHSGGNNWLDEEVANNFNSLMLKGGLSWRF